MTNDLAVIRGCFSDWRPVKSRSVLQLVIEVPIETTENVIAKLGVPLPGVEKWVAVALLKPAAEPVPEPVAEQPRVVDAKKSEMGRERYALADKADQAKARAVMLVKDQRFREWLGKGETYRYDEIGAACRIREICGVSSKREFSANPEALERFLRLETDFMVFTGKLRA